MEGEHGLLLQTPASHAGRLVRALTFVGSAQCAQPPTATIFGEDSLVHCVFSSAAALVEFRARLRESFILRHISRVFQVDHRSSSVAEAVAALVAKSGKEHVYRMLAFPKAQEEALGDLIPLEVQLAMSGNTHVFACVRAAANSIYWGIIPASAHVTCTVGQANATLAPQPVSRAYWKLDEAVHRYAIHCNGSRALDIGAAPGGWTQFLAHAGAARIVAIDPAVLLIPQSSTVLHLRLRLQEALKDRALLAEAPFDLLVADMNIHPNEAAELMVLAAALLKGGARLVMTAKLVAGYSAAHERDAQLRGCTEILKKAFEDVTEFWALSNGNERTVIASRRASPSPSVS